MDTASVLSVSSTSSHDQSSELSDESAFSSEPSSVVLPLDAPATQQTLDNAWKNTSMRSVWHLPAASQAASPPGFTRPARQRNTAAAGPSTSVRRYMRLQSLLSHWKTGACLHLHLPDIVGNPVLRAEYNKTHKLVCLCGAQLFPQRVSSLIDHVQTRAHLEGVEGVRLQQTLATQAHDLSELKAVVIAQVAAITRSSHSAIARLHTVEKLIKAIPSRVFQHRAAIPDQLTLAWMTCHAEAISRLRGAPLAAIVDESPTSWPTLSDQPRLVAVVLQNLTTNFSACIDIIPETTASGDTVREIIRKSIMDNDLGISSLMAVISDNAAYMVKCVRDLNKKHGFACEMLSTHAQSACREVAAFHCPHVCAVPTCCIYSHRQETRR